MNDKGSLIKEFSEQITNLQKRYFNNHWYISADHMNYGQSGV